MSLSLTVFRLRRIREADARDIARMVDQEHYWTSESVQEILRRVEILSDEDPEQAVRAAHSAIDIVERRIVEPPVSLRARALSVLGSTLRINGELEEALKAFERASPELSADHSLISSIVNIAASLSYEAGADVEPTVLKRVQEAIPRYRELLATKGSQFYKVRRLRLMLSRAEALVLARVGEEAQAVQILERVVRGLRPKLPDDALDASVDLMCLLAKMEDEEAAVIEARRTLEIAEEAKSRPGLIAMTVLANSVKKEQLSVVEAVEMRIRLRSPA